jgi:hypothetical protein
MVLAAQPMVRHLALRQLQTFAALARHQALLQAELIGLGLAQALALASQQVAPPITHCYPKVFVAQPMAEASRLRQGQAPQQHFAA